MRSLVGACNFAALNYAVEDDTDRLLMHHLVEMRDEVAEKVRKRKPGCTMTMNSREALAFMMLWLRIDLSQGFGPLERQLMQEIINEIDAYQKMLATRPPIWEDVTDYGI